VDADPRKQGMSEGSVLAHVTEANDEADKGDAPLGEQNGALPRTPPKGAALWKPAKGAQAPLESRNHGRFCGEPGIGC
jgi:hypothetical protein